jgi:hypothetical protein
LSERGKNEFSNRERRRAPCAGMMYRGLAAARKASRTNALEFCRSDAFDRPTRADECC